MQTKEKKEGKKHTFLNWFFKRAPIIFYLFLLNRRNPKQTLWSKNETYGVLLQLCSNESLIKIINSLYLNPYKRHFLQCHIIFFKYQYNAVDRIQKHLTRFTELQFILGVRNSVFFLHLLMFNIRSA